MTTAGKALDIQGTAEALLAAIVDHYTAAAVPLPQRQYVAPGDPGEIAWDCEQLVVSIQGIGWGQAPSAATQSPHMGTYVSATAVRHAIFDIALVRCTPSVGDRNTGVPRAEDIHAAGLAFMRDMGLMSQALVVACATVRAGLEKTSLVEPGVVNPAGPSGGFHGLAAQIAITVGEIV